MSKIKPWDEYEIKARYIPTFLSSVPLVHFLLLFLGQHFWQNFNTGISWMLIANIGLSSIVMLALVQIQCGFSKHWVEEPVFGKGGINFPTTDMLLISTTLISAERKEQIRNKITQLFGCTFSTIDEERNNPTENTPSTLSRGVQRIVDLKSTIIAHRFTFLFVDVLLYHFVCNIARTDCKVTTSPKMTSPEFLSYCWKF